MFRMWLERYEIDFLVSKGINFEVLRQDSEHNVELAFVEFGSIENWKKANEELSTLQITL